MQKGFTLIELLVVVLIIGILSAGALPQYQKAVLKARYTQLQISLDALASAEQAYYLENGDYTNDWDALPISIKKYSANIAIYTDIGNSSDSVRAAVGTLHADKNLTIPILGYVIYLSSRKRECRVMKNEDIYHTLCKNMTGKTTGVSCGTSCTAYQY